jgi:cysteine desulfurase/selenocysteine lyase
MSFDATAIRKQFPVFLTKPGGRALHYLDNAAMAQMPRAVSEAMLNHDTTSRANVHRGLHPLAERADQAFEAARMKVARHLNAGDAGEVVFTPGCTAAINFVAQALAGRWGPGDEVVVSRADHHSTLLPWMREAERRGLNLRFLPLTAEGIIDENRIAEVIGPDCRLIAVAHASNVTGAWAPVTKLVAAARAVGALVLLDGAQAIVHGRVDVRKLGADFYCFSGHKVFGPTGIGVLWGRHDVLRDMPPPLVGGGMVSDATETGMAFLPPPQRFEAGTPPITQAVGLAAGLGWLDDLDRTGIAGEERRLAAKLLDGLADFRRVRLFGPSGTDHRLPIISFTVDGAHPHDIAQLLGERGVAVRGGQLCAQPLMAALGADTGVVRASLALYNDDGDIDALLDGLSRAIKVLT